MTTDQAQDHSTATLSAHKLQKRYGSRTVVRDVSVEVKCGEVVGLLGPNGAGKTTSFYMIVGLVPLDGGNIILDGVDTSATPVRDRQVGFVFQHYALFKHMTVFDNVAFGLQVKNRKERPSKEEIADFKSSMKDFLE